MLKRCRTSKPRNGTASLPAGIPAEIRQRLTDEICKAMLLPELKKRLETEGAEYWDVTPEQFRAHVAAEIPRWKEVVEQAKSSRRISRPIYPRAVEDACRKICF